jgi:hypothetical protein
MQHRRAIELLTEAQVFSPAVVPDLALGGFIVFSAMRVLGRGATIDEAMRNARENIPPSPGRPRYEGQGYSVTLRGEVVATAKSRTYADRIANALNQYNPNERGI